MRQLVYASAATAPFTTDALRKLLEGARRHNTSVGITGMLLHVNGAFLQVLEGDPAAVDTLYAKLGRDRRHGRVITLVARDIDVRNFADWSMGFVDASHRAASLEGYRATNGFADLAGDSKAVSKIIEDFRGGRWAA